MRRRRFNLTERLDKELPEPLDKVLDRQMDKVLDRQTEQRVQVRKKLGVDEDASQSDGDEGEVPAWVIDHLAFNTQVEIDRLLNKLPNKPSYRQYVAINEEIARRLARRLRR
jgi:hypothetical protein